MENNPDLIDPGSVKLRFLIDSDGCTPCEQVLNHLKEYGGEVEIIDPLSDEAESFWENDQVASPSARIETKDGKELPCEVFMDDQNLVLKCDGKLLIVKEPSGEET